MTPANVEQLESELFGGSVKRRLSALRNLCATAEKRERIGTNLHIHTNESFSVFRSPTEAVWQAVCEGLLVFGINDHYTVAGHEEFRLACQLAHIPATFSLEAVAMDRQAEASSTLLNDSDNPGRVYLCGKGVTRVPSESSPAIKKLTKMRAALLRRNRQMTEKVRALFRVRLNDEGPTWEDVVKLTPRGNVTERHVAQAILFRLRTWAEAREAALLDAIEQCCEDTPASTDNTQLQGFLRARLLKAGGACYVEEARTAFLSIAEMRDLFLAFGAIPTYPVLGNPVTPFEEDIESLLDRLEATGIFALEVIPHRNTRERLTEIVGTAKARSWPVFNGTEHNTPEPMPLLFPLSLDPEFAPWFEASSAVLLGHQQLVAQGKPGFLKEDGSPSIAEARARFEHLRLVGRQVIEETLA